MRSSALLVLAAALLAGGLAYGADKDEDNPHEKMVRSRSVCIDCHTRVPKVGEHAADYFLVDAASETCLGCHDENEHAGAKEHLGKDATNVATQLPRDENGKMACFTCHDPHPAGVLEGRDVYKTVVSPATRAFIAARPLPKSAELRQPSETLGALLRIPVANEGCFVCHASVKEASPWREKTLWSERIRVLPSY
jgi:hypothetical protein